MILLDYIDNISMIQKRRSTVQKIEVDEKEEGCKSCTPGPEDFKDIADDGVYTHLSEK
jgi:hypothetical protein